MTAPTTKLDFLNAQMAVLNNQITAIDLNANMNKTRIEMQKASLQTQIDALTPSPT